MITIAFVPKDLYVESTDLDENGNNKQLKVLFCEANSRGGVIYFVEQYYGRNFARSRQMSIDQLSQIDGYETRTQNVIKLYQQVFGE
jgi:hypothetical protein